MRPEVQDGTNWLQASSVAMGSISQITQRVRELLVQAQNGTNSPSDLKAIGIEVTQLTEAIKQDANTQYAGQYVVRGHRDDDRPLRSGSGRHDSKATPKRLPAAIAPGATVTVNTDLASVLGNGQASADGKLLDTLRTIAQHLGEATPESKAALAGDMTNLTANMETMTRVQSKTAAPPTAADRLGKDRIAAELDHPGPLQHRGRKLREDLDRVLDRAGRLLSSPAGFGQHRPGIPAQLPALGIQTRGTPCP